MGNNSSEWLQSALDHLCQSDLTVIADGLGTDWEQQHDEIKRLQAWKADVEDSMKIAAGETCDMSERHCTCVPLLRVEIKRLQKENSELCAEIVRLTAEKAKET